MGLDIYLNKKTYVGNKWRAPEKRVTIVIPKDQEGVYLPAGQIKNERIQEITEEVAYWRKANAIHAWFVQNVQNGKDDCGTYYVSSEQLQALLDIVTKVLKASELVDGDITNRYQSKDGQTTPIIEKGKFVKNLALAKELLPTQSGFFFGNTDYDQYYIDDLTYTKKALEEILQENGDYYYQSSW